MPPFNWKALPLALLLITFVGCSGTPYQPLDSAEPYDVGYESQQLDDHSFSVTFWGNPRSSLDRVRELALLRAAEITKECDFSHFRIENEQNVGPTVRIHDQITVTTPIAGNSGRRRPGIMTNNFMSEGQSSSRISRVPALKLTILPGSAATLPPAPNVYRANDVIKKMRAKYSISP